MIGEALARGDATFRKRVGQRNQSFRSISVVVRYENSHTNTVAHVSRRALRGWPSDVRYTVSDDRARAVRPRFGECPPR